MTAAPAEPPPALLPALLPVVLPVVLPVLLHRGDAQHGVDRCAKSLADATRAMHPGVRLELDGDASDAERVHLHFTDRLWGASPESAADAVEAIAAGSRVAVTLHDVPQVSDGVASMRRRTEAYRRVVDAAELVVCNSRHERALLRAALGDVAAEVVPLPAAAPLPRPQRWEPLAEVAVLGFFYPGKGHREAVDAVASLEPSIAVTAIGRAAPGHEAELAELQRYAAARGVHLSATGFVPDDGLLERARRAAVPVVAHQHVSASGSLNDWIAAGRRPITIVNDYFAEMAALRPGTVELVERDGLAAAVAAALLDPSRTWLPDDASSAPHLDDTAAAYLDLWAAW